MTIIDAVKTGKPIKRTSWAIFMVIDQLGATYIASYDGQDHPLVGKSANLDNSDILATDWEVKV